MTTPTLFKEYIWLVNTIHRARVISRKELNRLWVRTEMSGGVEMSRTTFYRHKSAIEDVFGIYIECDSHNRYYIGNANVLDEDSVQNWVVSTLSVSNMVGESKSLHQRILLENIPSGGVHLQLIIQAMKESRRLLLTYRKYHADSNTTYTLEPYCVKLFRQRWYVVGRTDKPHLVTFSLDRMVSVELSDTHFKIDEMFDAADFFSESYGIVVDDHVPLQRIVLRAYGYEPYYLRDLPLHSSQREIASTEDYTDFELRLKPTNDFKTKLLSRGEWLQVLEPQSLADEIIEWHQKAIERYPGHKRV